MSLSILFFFFFYLLIINTTIGHGYLVYNIAGLKKEKFDYGMVGLCGILVLILVSYISHYFLPHNYFHNSIILLVGLISFLYFFYKEKKKLKIINLKIFFILLFISFLIFKSHDDFPYYHFPYTYYLTQYKIFFGIGNLNHGFRTPSSIFYLNSLFYLPYIKYYFFNIV